MVEGILFDFGGVISSFDSRLFFERLAERSPKSAGEMAAFVIEADLPRKYESGEISSREFYAAITGSCEVAISEKEFVEAFAGIFLPIEPTFRLVRALKPSYRIGLLSNTNEWHFERYIRTVEIFPLFDAVTLSYRVGEMKPGERIYRDALEKIGLPPHSCVFIDDLEENVAAAKRLGIRGIHYTGHDRLIESLNALGILAG
ncbi:MAG: HAD family phosphatase [Deltaproteobacteria bacterium]